MYKRQGLESGQLTQERLDEAVLRVLAFKAMLRLYEKQRTNALMPAEEGLSVIGCPEHRAAAARIIDVYKRQANSIFKKTDSC